MKRFTFVILLLAFFGLYSSILVLDFIVMDNSTESQCSTLNYLTKSSKAQSGYVEHEPIVISKNIDFDIYGFPGNGTAINPYRIQNLNITRAAYLIKIQNTTSHFMISSCLLNGIDKSKPGIYFSNVTNGELKHNELYNAYNGLWFERLKNSTLVNNTIQDTGRWGIVLSSCKNVTLEENKVINNVRDGIWLSKSNNCLLKNNTLTKNDIGIKNLGSPNINITLNTIYNNSEGINIAATGATTNIILANHIYNNTGDGIELGVSASSTQILNNTISNNTQYGVNLFAGSSESLVKWNYFISNNPGGSSQGYSYTTNNKFHYNYWSDWTTPDDDSNNIVDIPYSIDGYGSLIDPYPLVYTSLVTFHYLPPPTIISPNGNVVLSGNALIQWTEVVDSLDHSVNYTIFYSATNGTNWAKLVSGLTNTSYSWDTTTMDNGALYLVKVVVHCSDGLTMEDNSDDTFTIENIPSSSSQSTSATTPSSSSQSTSAASTSPSVSQPLSTSNNPINPLTVLFGLGLIGIIGLMIRRKGVRKTD